MYLSRFTKVSLYIQTITRIKSYTAVISIKLRKQITITSFIKRLIMYAVFCLQHRRDHQISHKWKSNQCQCP